jgi:hypothetical protein
MKSTLVVLTFTALSVIWGPTASALAADARVAKGTITAIGGQSLTVKVGEHDMAFTIDAGTLVQARGAATTASRFAAAGKPGPHLIDLLHTGQAVAVRYRDMAGSLRASEIKAISKAPSTDDHADMRSTGVVKSIGADWLTINGNSGGGGTFEQTFKVDPKTKVFAKGAGTAVAATGGKAPFSELVSNGDLVTVSYHKQGTSLLASGVHVTTKVSH